MNEFWFHVSPMLLAAVLIFGPVALVLLLFVISKWRERLWIFISQIRNHFLFMGPRGQIRLLREWNTKLGLEISEEQFQEASRLIPPRPKGRLTARVLVFYLPKFEGKSGIERTFNAWWECIMFRHKASWRAEIFQKMNSDQLHLFEEMRHPADGEKTVLRWETIQLDADPGAVPAEAASSQFSAHAGVLAAAAFHVRWMTQMEGGHIPAARIAGYVLKLNPLGLYVVTLGFDRLAKVVMMRCDRQDLALSFATIPKILARQSC